MKNENLDFEKVLAAFQDYLAKDDCVEVIKTTRGCAVIQWDDRQNNWEEIEHCPSPAILQQTLLDTMATFLECGYTSGKRDLTDAEKHEIQALLNQYIRM